MDKKLKWHQHFLQTALLQAQMSKDPSTRVGAVIVGPDKEIRSTGYNGFPRGILDSEERLNNRELKNLLMVHAETNAILSAARVGIPVKDCTLYLCAQNTETGEIWGGAPCIRCTVEVINAGLKRIITYPFKNVPSRWKENIEFSQKILREADIEYIEIEKGN